MRRDVCPCVTYTYFPSYERFPPRPSIRRSQPPVDNMLTHRNDSSSSSTLRYLVIWLTFLAAANMLFILGLIRVLIIPPEKEYSKPQPSFLCACTMTDALQLPQATSGMTSLPSSRSTSRQPHSSSPPTPATSPCSPTMTGAHSSRSPTASPLFAQPGLPTRPGGRS